MVHKIVMHTFEIFIVGLQSWKSSDLREAVAHRCSIKELFLKVSQNSQENKWATVSFLIKLQAFRFRTGLGTSVFLWILKNFLRTYFLWNNYDGCFGIYPKEVWEAINFENSKCFEIKNNPRKF